MRIRGVAGRARVDDALKPSLLYFMKQAVLLLRLKCALMHFYRVLIDIRDYVAAEVRLPLWKAYLTRWKMGRELDHCERRILSATLAFMVRVRLGCGIITLTFTFVVRRLGLHSRASRRHGRPNERLQGGSR